MVLFQWAPCTSSPPYFPCAFLLLYEMTSGCLCGHRSVVTQYGRIESYDKGDVIVGRGDVIVGRGDVIVSRGDLLQR